MSRRTERYTLKSLRKMDEWLDKTVLSSDEKLTLDEMHLLFLSSFSLRLIDKVIDQHDAASRMSVGPVELLMAQTQVFYLMWKISEKLGERHWDQFAIDHMPPHGDELEDRVKAIIGELHSRYTKGWE